MKSALTRLDRMLWDQGPASFLPHGLAGGTDDARQPILLSSSPDAPNVARNILIADGEWRDAALAYDRAFYLFDTASLEARGWHGSCSPDGKGSSGATGRRSTASGSRGLRLAGSCRPS